MAIPDYQTLMLPVLQLVQDDAEYKFRTAVETLAERFNLTDEERAELLPSGSQPIFDNRVGWARTYLKQARLIDSSRRGFFHITERGKRLLDQNPEEINVKFLEQFDEFQEFRKRKKDKSNSQEEIQKFAGALQGQRAKKGVFITTSNFSREAEQYAAFIDSRMILIDGARLVKLMFENNVGVSTVGSYQIKRIDSDYFEDE